MNQSQREIDYPALIAHLKDSGMTTNDIAEQSGVGQQIISGIANEGREISNLPFRLLQLFWWNTDIDIPLLGDHHEILNKEKV